MPRIQTEAEVRTILARYFDGLDENSNPITSELKNLREDNNENKALRCEMFENQIRKMFSENIEVKLKVIPSFVNLILKLDIIQRDENNEPVTDSYCVNIEQLALLEPDELASRDHVSNNVPAIQEFLTPVYAKKEIDTDTYYSCRINLLPFYEKGTLMKFCGYESLLSAEAFEAYKKDYQLKALRHQYFGIPHGYDYNSRLPAEQKVKLNAKQLQQLYDSPTLTHHAYLAARNEILSSEKPADKTENMIRFFEALLTTYNTTLSDNASFQQSSLKQGENEDDNFYADRINAYFQPQESENSASYVSRIDQEVLGLYNLLQTELEKNPYTLPSDVMRTQQEKLFEKMGELLYLATIFHREGVQYDDLKPENILINEINKSEISDKKTLHIFNSENKVKYPTHLTYYPPEYDPNQTELSKEDAQSMTLYQLGAMFYNMVIGLSAHDIGGQAHLVDKELIRLGLKNEFDFTHPHFQTELGQAFKQLIQPMVVHRKEERPTLDTVCVCYNRLKNTLNPSNDNLHNSNSNSDNSSVNEGELKVVAEKIVHIPTPENSDSHISVNALNNYEDYFDSDKLDTNHSIEIINNNTPVNKANDNASAIEIVNNDTSINDEQASKKKPAPKLTSTASFFANPQRVAVTALQAISTLAIATTTTVAMIVVLKSAPAIIGASAIVGGPIGAGLACGGLLLLLGGLLMAASAAKMMAVDKKQSLELHR